MLHRRLSLSLLVTALHSFAGCKPSAPSEPAAPTVQPARPAESARDFRPALDESLRRIADALRQRAVEDDAAAPEAPQSPRRIAIGGVPAIDVVAARVGERWTVAAIEHDRVSLGLAGAERIYQLREQAQRPMSAAELARTVGVLLYYPYPIFDGTTWSDTPLSNQSTGRTSGAIPVLTPRPQGGRDLMFSFFIPNGMSGAGDHFAHVRVTDSTMLIDMAPNPERR
jgi:hypothetical protein